MRLGLFALIVLSLSVRVVGAPNGALCKEHAVLEAVCTQCNPALAAVFKAKGDWCQEHGFPKSFCPICKPSQGGRPTVDVNADDGAPADGTKVSLKTKEAARLAGIQTAKAGRTTSGSHVLVPRNAVQRAKSTHLVFVRLAEDVFEARRVRLGGSGPDFIEVRGRLKAGDEVATIGSFFLKTETLKGSIGAGCCEVEEKINAH